MQTARKILYGVVPALLFSVTLALDPFDSAQDRATAAEVRSEQGEQVEVHFGDQAKHACRPHGARFSESSFFLDELRDLYICVIWHDLAGTYVEQLTFILPDGNLYQVLTVPFVTPGASGPAEVEVDGRLFEVIEARWVGKGETGVVTVLPVAGTYITQRSLVGRWTVGVSLNGRLIGQLPLTLKKRD